MGLIKPKTVDMKVEVSVNSFLFGLKVDDEVEEALIEKLADSWDYTKELDTEFISRISLMLIENVNKRKQRNINYGGSPKANMEYCERELKAGRKVDSRKLRHFGN